MLNAKVLREGIEKIGKFNIVSKEVGVPLVAFSLKETVTHSTVFDVSENMRRFGWIIPAYTMPADAEHIAVLRVVIREDFGRSLAERSAQNFEISKYPHHSIFLFHLYILIKPINQLQIFHLFSIILYYKTEKKKHNPKPRKSKQMRTKNFGKTLGISFVTRSHMLQT